MITFKQFLAEAKKKNMFQVKVEGSSGGDWKDVAMYANTLQDIADSVGAAASEMDKMNKFDISQLADFVRDFIGEGPDGSGTSWDEMDMNVKSLSNEVLKISYAFGGVNMRQKQGNYGTEVTRKGTITIMPGN